MQGMRSEKFVIEFMEYPPLLARLVQILEEYREDEVTVTFAENFKLLKVNKV